MLTSLGCHFNIYRMTEGIFKGKYKQVILIFLHLEDINKIDIREK